MRVHNVRLGHACNSSSTHSILIFPKDKPVPPNDARGWEFGWNDFTLTDKDDKAAYTWIQMAGATTPAMADLILMGAGIEKPDGLTGAGLADYDTYVDHQSQLQLPYEFDEKMPSVAYAQELARFMNKPNAVILGGNDNSDGHPLVQAAFGGDENAREMKWQHESGGRRERSLLRRTNDGDLFEYTDNLGGVGYGSGMTVARKDDAMWTLFSRGNGNRMSVTFDDSPLPDRLTAPMLVDIKLTDYCAMGCPFCYQGSTPEGLHADTQYVDSLIYNLSRVQCFEIAFGGGEPTEHPDFGKFVLEARRYNIVPNVTSRNPSWFLAKTNAKAVAAIGAVAFSAETLSQLKKWTPFITRKNRWERPELTVQVIDGAIKATELEKIGKYAFDEGLRVTVLGWKETGRANEFTRRDIGAWMEWYQALKAHERSRVAVDTVIVQQYKAQFEEMGVARESYIDTEGRWSCYIDAVGRVIAPSSYGLVTESKSLNSPYDFAEVFPNL